MVIYLFSLFLGQPVAIANFYLLRRKLISLPAAVWHLASLQKTAFNIFWGWGMGALAVEVYRQT